MSRAIIIHRRDLGNVVYSSNPSYNPPNDNATIDDYGNTTSTISVPVRFPDMIRTGNRNVEGSTFVWAGNMYNVESITTDNLSAAFNLPNDITDTRLDKNDKYERVEPHFSVNITASTSSIYNSQSSIPSLAQKKIVITIPVYKESDYRKLGDSLYNRSGTVEYNPPENASRQQFNNFSDFNDSEFYGFVSTQPTSNEQMIQIIPKKICIIPDNKATGPMKQKWNYTCPSNSRELSRTDVVCRMKNTSEIAGYNQGNLTYYTNTSTNNTNFTENTRILRFRSIPFKNDPETPSNVSLQTPDGIPVQIEGEGSDGSTQNFRVVVDEPKPSLSLTNTGVLVYTFIVLAIGLFIITTLNHKSQFHYTTLLSIILLGCGITIPIIIFSNESSIKGFSLIWVSFIALILLISIITSVFVPNELLSIFPGIGNVVLLFLLSIFTFASTWILNTQKTEDQERNKTEYYLGYLLSNLPKIFVVLVLFFSNPISNLLACTSLFSGKKTSFDLKNGIEKILNNQNSIDFTDSDVARTLPSLRFDEIDRDNTLTSHVNDSIIRTYYSKMDRNTGTTNVSSAYGTIDQNQKFKKDSKSKTPSEGYQLIKTSRGEMFNFMNINQRFGIGIVVLLILSLSLILAQPSPIQKDEEGADIIDSVISTVLSVGIFLMIAYMKYTQQIGWVAFIPFTIAIIVNIVSNWTLYGLQ
jgi:hypothetical protein